MMSSELFQPFRMRGLELANRVVIAPMCQYSATDGIVGDWHLMHVGQFSVGGHGLFIAEATSVEPRGRISLSCPGIWTDEQMAAWKRVVDFTKTWGNTPIAIQLAHAGRKGSSRKPWQGGAQAPEDEGGWQTVAPSAVAFDAERPAPHALTVAEIDQIKQDFAAAARRADQAGFDAVEIHAAHGYLLHQFLSPLSNRRDDAYGGSLENRMRLALEIFDVVREAFPNDKPVGLRISATDWVEGGWDLADSIALAQALEDRSCDFIHVSSGGLSPEQEIPLGPGYQVDMCAAITEATEIATIAVGMINDALQAETIVRSGQADMIALARGMLDDPHWTWRAAKALNAEAAYPRQYERALPHFQTMAAPKDPPPK
ncbi:NADH:flavin oxidoreductase/NADH oxidase [Magnetovibrio sp.]|uniref:NADH:flavin oxidoreductase/NADH oxidase n=1 Tax=Magnetovibrio sp. TaxID=2024836 RepID=UPI002F92AD50